jgi:hypothetical protein
MFYTVLLLANTVQVPHIAQVSLQINNEKGYNELLE